MLQTRNLSNLIHFLGVLVSSQTLDFTTPDKGLRSSRKVKVQSTLGANYTQHKRNASDHPPSPRRKGTCGGQEKQRVCAPQEKEVV